MEKNCKNCVSYSDVNHQSMTKDVARCAHPAVSPNGVATSRLSFTAIYYGRSDETSCGSQGRYFTPKV